MRIRFFFLFVCLFLSPIRNPKSEIVPASAVNFTLVWQNPPDAIAARVYWGNGSRNYSWSEDVGLVSTVTIIGLDSLSIYYFAVSASYFEGDGPLSDEVIAGPWEALTSPAR